jgi:hypothetical protein
MTVLLPGFPITNPILAGVALVEAGGDLEAALLQRDAQLATPEAFLAAAWEALAWISPARPHITRDLLDQIMAAFGRLPPAQGAEWFQRWRSSACVLGQHQLLSLLHDVMAHV